MAENRKPFDDAFKSLSEANPRGFLEVMGVLDRGIEAEVELLPQELSRATVLFDAGLIVRPKAAPPFVAVFEAFARFDARHIQQVVEYNKALDSHHEFDQRTYMVPLIPHACPPNPPQRIEADKGGYGYFVNLNWIRPWEADGGLLLAQRQTPFDAWMALCRYTPEQETEALRRLEAARNLLSFEILAGLKYRYEKDQTPWYALVKRIESMLTQEDMRESLAVQAWLEKGRQEGIHEGRQEGREEGRQAAAEAILRRALKHFPSVALPAQLPGHLDLVLLTQEIVDAPNESSVRDILRSHGLTA